MQKKQAFKTDNGAIKPGHTQYSAYPNFTTRKMYWKVQEKIGTKLLKNWFLEWH